MVTTAPPVPGGVNVLVGGRANPCTFARIGITACPNNSKPNIGTLFVVLTKTQPPSDGRCKTCGTNSDNKEARLPVPSENDATEPTSCPPLSMAYTSTFADVV